MTKEQIKLLALEDEIDVLDVIDAVIEANRIIGVGLITLGEDLRSHCISYPHRQREEHVITPIDELIAIQRENAAKSFVKELRVAVPTKTHAMGSNVVQEFDDAYEKWIKQSHDVTQNVIDMYSIMSLNELVLYAYDYLGMELIHTFMFNNSVTKKELIVLLRELVVKKHVEYKKEVVVYTTYNINTASTIPLISISHMYTYYALPLNTMYKAFSTDIADVLDVNVISLQDGLFNDIFQVLAEANATYNGQKTTLSQRLANLESILNEYKSFSVNYLKHHLSTK